MEQAPLNGARCTTELTGLECLSVARPRRHLSELYSDINIVLMTVDLLDSKMLKV